MENDKQHFQTILERVDRGEVVELPAVELELANKIKFRYYAFRRGLKKIEDPLFALAERTVLHAVMQEGYKVKLVFKRKETLMDVIFKEAANS